jgi:hypothetical protein
MNAPPPAALGRNGTVSQRRSMERSRADGAIREETHEGSEAGKIGDGAKATVGVAVRQGFAGHADVLA